VARVNKGELKVSAAAKPGHTCFAIGT
jgi:hypothetical protein